MASNDILRVKNLNIWFQMREGFFKDLLAKEPRYAKAVDGVSFNIKKGEIFCLVGESGCGKTTTGKGILRLVEPTSGNIIFADEKEDKVMGDLIKSVEKTSITEERVSRFEFLGSLIASLAVIIASFVFVLGGSNVVENEIPRVLLILSLLILSPIMYKNGAKYERFIKAMRKSGPAIVTLEDNRPGLDVRRLSHSELKYARQRIQMIFQDPYESLNPKMTIFDIVAEPLVVNHLCKNESEKYQRVVKALNDAGLRPPEFFMWRYPHQVSGGQRQRVGIAGTLVLEPSLLVADEPISMLDVSIRGDILKLMLDLREKKRLSYLFITHDLSVAYVFSDRIGVMYLGRIVEMGPTERVIKNPKHPYTQALITVVPKPDPTAKEEKIILKGERPDPTNIPKGCRFHPRCPYVMEICKTEQPEATEIEAGHWAECFLLTPDVVKKWASEKSESGKAFKIAGEETNMAKATVASPAVKA